MANGPARTARISPPNPKIKIVVPPPTFLGFFPMSRIILSDRGSFLGKSGEQFRITRKDEPEALVPARKVEQILVLGSGISVSSDAIWMADELGTEILFASYYGKPLARLIPASLGGTVKTRREQYYA